MEDEVVGKTTVPRPRMQIWQLFLTLYTHTHASLFCTLIVSEELGVLIGWIHVEERFHLHVYSGKEELQKVAHAVRSPDKNSLKPHFKLHVSSPCDACTCCLLKSLQEEVI
jgi:hypothetical protein